jgi:hypothetical protein
MELLRLQEKFHGLDVSDNDDVMNDDDLEVQPKIVTDMI